MCTIWIVKKRSEIILNLIYDKNDAIMYAKKNIFDTFTHLAVSSLLMHTKTLLKLYFLFLNKLWKLWRVFTSSICNLMSGTNKIIRWINTPLYEIIIKKVFLYVDIQSFQRHFSIKCFWSRNHSSYNIIFRWRYNCRVKSNFEKTIETF